MKHFLAFSKRLSFIPRWIWVCILFVATHLPAITLLPVFADEAIYIRWAQLVQDDIGRYAFFSMADGKPPLFMWLLSVTLHFFADPLLAGRITSLLIGLATVFVLRLLVAEFTPDRLARWVVTLCGIFLPFWFFYHRMVLMDGLLTLLIASSFYAALRLSKIIMSSKNSELLHMTRLQVGTTVMLGAAFGGALMTKTPALFVIPIIALTPLYVWLFEEKRTIARLLKALLWVGCGGLLGGLFFGTLRISPLFGALFSRTTDFTFSLKEIIGGEWKYVLFESLPRNAGWVIYYMTPELSIISLVGLFWKKTREQVAFLLLCSFLFLLPLTLFGRVLWPRYFLPSAIFLTLAIGISVTTCAKQKTLGLVCMFLLLFASVRAAYFMGVSFKNPAEIPFVADDRSQYLNEWSAGYGNTQVRDFIVEQQSQLPKDGSKKIIVLTEGSFGTLPDGLLMYFHNNNAQNLEIHGIGVSVAKIPDEFVALAGKDDVYYVLNSHRFGLQSSDGIQKIFEVERPDGPSLLFYKVLPIQKKP